MNTLSDDEADVPTARQHWSEDVNSGLAKSRNMAWIVAAGAGAVALIEAIALVVLMPLKTVVPYTIAVDRQSGYVETVRGVSLGALSENETLIQSFVMQYVLARETFDATDLRENYRKVMLWSQGSARRSYEQSLARANPESVVNALPATTILQVRVKSVSMLSKGSAIVRFETIRRDDGAVMGELRSYSAVLAFGFSESPMRMDDRALNPLGFQVTQYRRDADSTAMLSVRLDEVTGRVE
jgi:type IV secretion system protein VirB8